MNLCDLGLSNSFFDIIPEAKTIKETLDKLNFIRIKNVCYAKDTIKRVGVEKTTHSMFANHLLDKGLVSRMYRGVLTQ